MIKFLLQAIIILIISNKLVAQSSVNALHFDGTDDNVTANLPVLFNNLAANDFTIEAWVKPQGSAFSRILFAQSSSTNFATISTGSTNNIYFYVVEGGTTYSIATTNNLPLNIWTHVAVRWTTLTNQVDVFYNGLLQTGAAGGSSSTGTLNNLSIGTRPGGAQYFTGAMDEVRIWSEARTNCEILANYQREMAGNEPNLVLYYNFNEGLAGSNNTGVTNLPDLVSTNDGALNNFGLTAATSNWIASGALINASGEVGAVTTTMNASSCSNVGYSFNGQLLINSGIYNDTLTSTSGCDSIIALNFTALNPTSSSQNASGCNSYLWIQNNQTYTTSGSYNDTLTNAVGCDSIVTLNLLINNAVSGTDVQSACGSYTWIDGNNYTSSNGTATFNIVGGAANGCDSLVTLNLTINNSSTGTDVQSACGSYTWIDGNNYTASNSTATFNIAGGAVNGCDSLVTLNLMITTIDLSITNSSNVLTSNQNGATYQWLDCTNSYAVIPLETTQNFTATINGSYAVEISIGSCVDTSACENINTIGIKENNDAGSITIYPNPATANITIESTSNMGTIMIVDVNGKVVYKEKTGTNKTNINTAQLINGVYMIQIMDASNIMLKTLRIVITK